MKIEEVVGNINRGGFGIIDKVKCDDGNHYARKAFSPSDQFKDDVALCERLKIRFIREVKTQKILPAEYFIPIVFEDLVSARPYFLMPLADDVYTSEIERCRGERRNPEGLGDILNALEFLHDKGLVHRDLKPQNILKHNGRWKLADFGLITQDKEILSQTITTTKQAFGTTMYCAPEQVIEFNRITPQADIYSFGAILHDIFTDGNRVPYSELEGPGEIGQIISKCTRHKKEQRFKSIKSIRSKLLTLLSNSQTVSYSQSDIEWQGRFADIDKWDEDTLENFIFYLKQSDTISNLVLNRLTENILPAINLLNRDLFNDLSLIYLDWVYKSTFLFDYCDVVVDNIFAIYQLSKDIEVKSKCAISAAELGKTHNRFYVMRFVLNMSSQEIDDNLAFRIAMDIELEERNRVNFTRCVAQIGSVLSSYHKLIHEALK